MKHNNQTDSAIGILKSIRNSHYKKSEYYFFAFMILLGILLLDGITIFAARSYVLNVFGWAGVAILIVAIGFCLKDYLIEKNEANIIDSFYIEKMYKLMRQNK